MKATFRASILIYSLIVLMAPGGHAVAQDASAGTNAVLPFVSPMFGNDMVLQRGKPNPIWGWAKPGTQIVAEIEDHATTATAGDDGRWQLVIDPPPVGGPYTISISGAGQTVVLHEVLVGDVWLCGGQSNMELGLGRAEHGAEEIAAANHPEIRFFKVHSQVAYAPAAVPQGDWEICTPQTAGTNGGVSAVAYFYGRSLQEKLHVPIGLVVDCLGGTPVESWMSPASLRTLHDFDRPLDEIERLHAKGGPEYGSFLMHWLDENDAGNNLWSAENFDDSAWKTLTLPGDFSSLGVGDEPCVCWFRKQVVLPDPLPVGPAVLGLGPVEKMDTTYVNGQWVGASSWVENPRFYLIGKGILKPGTNEIAIRVFRMKPHGGFLGKPDSLRLVLGDKSVIPLAGDWKGALSADVVPPRKLPLMFENYPTMPAVLFEGMIQPVAPLAIRGAIWYQGEANFTRAVQYRTLLPLMIGDWRAVFGQGDFPFYIVSLPAFMHRRDQAGDDSWAELREAQALTAQSVKHSGLAVTVDTGDADNIHPAAKKIVGERLALVALANEYGQPVVCAGPTYESATPAGGAIKINFTNTDGGLVVKGDALKEFSIAGKDRQWHWADAKVDANSVIVASPYVPAPVAVRYAWQANPAATLYNGAGLPAAPFRTDNWPLSTANAKPW
jgi:sialate O-acetylesterase